ncbi:MAG: fimbrial protein [Bacteroides intestinalis]|nr:fimbrial protein [Bacteroides intestinalis]
MKKVSFFAMLAAVALMTGTTSCSNDDNVGEDGQSGAGERASLTITIDNPAMSRAGGTALTGDNAVKNFTVFVVDDKGDIPWKQYVDLSSGGANPATLTVSTNAKEVYVIANAGNQTGTHTAKSTLVAVTEMLSSQVGTTGARWATGNATIANSDWKTNAGNMEANISIDLQFIAARITVKVDNQMSNYDGTAGTILKNVAVLNANTESLLFGSGTPLSLIPGNGMDLQAGLILNNIANWPTSATAAVAYLADSYDNAGSFPNNTQDFYYYVYENNATTAGKFPTIVTVVGVDADGNDVYYPVHLAPYEQWGSGSTSASVQRGKSYDITITLKGDASKGNGGGGTDPTIPVTTAELEVTIDIKDWQPVTLTKEFQ